MKVIGSLEEIKEKAKKIRGFQNSSRVHSLTHGDEHGKLVLQIKELEGNQYQLILHCLECDYIQEDIPNIVFEMEEKLIGHNPVKELFEEFKEGEIEFEEINRKDCDTELEFLLKITENYPFLTWNSFELRDSLLTIQKERNKFKKTKRG